MLLLVIDNNYDDISTHKNILNTLFLTQIIF